ncbi:MAG: ferritin-like domain-containing protein [Pirellulaceae bacterium]|nr:ferritin-like domain-containing protein [Pirellulaceae bacterium]
MLTAAIAFSKWLSNDDVRATMLASADCWPIARAIIQNAFVLRRHTMAASREEIIEMLEVAYSMELETVMNYIANSVNLDGVRAEEIKKSLAADVNEELLHAQQIGQRIKQIGGLVPGSAAVNIGGQMQPPEDTTDVTAVIRAVIAAEQAACNQYVKIIKATDGDDYVTQDMCIRLLAAEEEHLVLFKGFLKEYTQN